MTVREVAEYTRLPISTLYSMNSEGTAPPRYKAGKRVLYRRHEVIAWLESRLVET